MAIKDIARTAKPVKIHLRITSPPMQEPKYPVLAAQHLLANNRYKLDFHPGVHDGVYGHHTAAAARRAKFLLGYPRRKVSRVFGVRLYCYLVGFDAPHAIKRPMTYRLRGAVRLRRWKRQEAKRTSKRIKAVNLALSQVGIKESPPFSNDVKYSYWYGFAGPWCAMFASWCFSMVGRPLRYASVSELHWDAANHHNGLDLTGSPEKGDLCCMNFGQEDEHVGMYLEQDSTYTFKMVSGNTGLTAYANGGEVLVGTFSRSSVDAWVRVQ